MNILDMVIGLLTVRIAAYSRIIETCSSPAMAELSKVRREECESILECVRAASKAG